MALKKRFREATRNEFRFLFFVFVLFLVVLMIVTTVATSLYLYFSSFVPSLASDCKKVQKLVLAVCLLDRKILNKSPDHLFDLIFFTACSIQLSFKPMFKVFCFELQKYLKKINSPFSV